MRFPFKKPHTNMKHTLQVLTYNNYYNRIIKVEDDLEAYAEYVVFSIEGVNFNENDGIDTEHILGGTTEYDGKGDYLLSIDENNNFKRWFILEAQRTRAGQWKISLRRDLVADYKENAITAPAFIEKATVDANDVAIFNSENMSFNQIKTSQTKIMDATKKAWMIAYLEKDTGITGTFSSNKPNILDVDGIENWQYYKYSQLANSSMQLILDDSTFEFSYIPRGSTVGSLLGTGPYTPPIYGYSLNGKFSYSSIAPLVVTRNRAYTEDLKGYIGDEYSIFEGRDLKSYFYDISSKNYVSEIKNVEYEYIRDIISGKLYSVSVAKLNKESVSTYMVSSGDYANVYAELKLLVVNWANSKNRPLVFPGTAYEGSTGDNHTFKLNLSLQNYQYVLEEVSDIGERSYNISELHPTTIDSVYDILVIPYGDYTISHGNENFKVDKEISVEWINDIVRRGGSKVFDAQLLPYVPNLYGVIEINDEKIEIDDSLYQEGKSYAILKDEENNPIGIGLFASKSMFSKIIPFNFVIPQDEWKIENECSTWRLNSPNWSSIFEFNVVKNGGQITEFSVDCHYKPYTPYINVAPTWSGLYGKSFEKEARGLILSGDFSIPRLDAAWTQYQLNNKTYEMAFNRQIQSVELKNRQQDVRDVVNAVAGTVQGGVSGAATGAMVGGAYGAIAGAAVGTVSSAVGGAIDVGMSRALRADQLDLTRDLYGYNLQSIKARPDTLTNVSAFNADNSIFPTLEYYTCTETEKQALRDKMKYNGMTVMRIGRIVDFLLLEPQYIKARIIRLEGMDEDFHLVNELVNEIYKGVFI